jgi:thioredoxin-like negative regulator of GroEL
MASNSNIIPWNNSINLDKETILLIFSTSWCPPCKALVPVLDTLATMITANQFKICKIDCEEEAALAQRFNIRSVPTIVLVHNGQIKSFSKNRDANTMYQWVMENIA